MRKAIAFILIFVLTFTASSCSGTEEDLGDDYLMGSDNPYYFDTQMGVQIAESEDSYYFFGGYYLYSKDKKTGEVTVLCDKPNCLHDREEDPTRVSSCNAFFNNPLNFCYYQNKLYILNTEPGQIETTAESIYEVDVSGSTRKEVFQSKEEISAFMVHRGYLYLSFTDFLQSPEDYQDEEKIADYSYRVERYSLQKLSANPEVIYQKTGKYGQINSMFAYGNQVYLRVTSDEGEDLVYDLRDKSVVPIPTKTRGLSVVDHQLLFFERIDKEGSVSYDDYKDKKPVLADLKGNPVGEMDIKYASDLFSAGEFIITDNEMEVLFDYIDREDRAIQIYDKAGKLLREVKLKNDTMPSLGMNADYFFYLKRPQEENGQEEIWAVDLHKLDDPNLEGEPFFCYVPPVEFPGVVTER